MSTTDAIHGVFPTPVYIVKRDSNLSPEEEKEIEDIIKEGTHKVGDLDYHTENTYLFDTKLKNIKQFCEQQIKIYVKKVLNPERELDFYITQSWLNVVEPGGNIGNHYHANSIISGAFYISTEEDDKITFRCPNMQIKELIKFDEPKEYNHYNSLTWSFTARTCELLLFPSWLSHMVMPNKKATRDRISLSFNIFVKELSEVIVTPAGQEHFNRQFC